MPRVLCFRDECENINTRAEVEGTVRESKKYRSSLIFEIVEMLKLFLSLDNRLVNNGAHKHNLETVLLC